MELECGVRIMWDDIVHDYSSSLGQGEGSLCLTSQSQARLGAPIPHDDSQVNGA